MKRSFSYLFLVFFTAGFVWADPHIQIEFKFLELDEVDYDVVKEELLATRLPGDFEGLNRSQVPVGFWKKVETFPGAEIISAPHITALENKQAEISIGDFLTTKVTCTKKAKGIGVDMEVKMEEWKRRLVSSVTLPEGVQAMVGSLSNSQGRRVLVLCQASCVDTKASN
jgi:hypothetical protein